MYWTRTQLQRKPMHCYRISQVAEWRACSPKHQSEHSGHHRWAADLRVFNGAFVTTRKEKICDRRITSGKSNATLLKPILRIIIPVQSMLIRNSWFSWELAIVKEVSPRGFSPEGLGNVGLSFFMELLFYGIVRTQVEGVLGWWLSLFTLYL